MSGSGRRKSRRKRWPTLRVGIIGLGRIGAQWDITDNLRAKPATHLSCWLQLADEVYAADSDTTRFDEVLRLHKDNPKFRGGAYDYKYFDHLLGHDMPVDVISVATPAETHAEIVTFLARAHAAKLIFCEKPIATTVKEATKMVRTCKENGVKLAVNHTRRWDPLYREVAAMVKRYGGLDHTVAHFSGTELNVGVHMADLLNWYGAVDDAWCNIMLHKGEYLIFELDLFFERGRVRVVNNGEKFEDYISYNTERYEHTRELALKDTVWASSLLPRYNGQTATPMLLACKQLADCVTKAVEPYCTGEDGLKALERALEWEKTA